MTSLDYAALAASVVTATQEGVPNEELSTAALHDLIAWHLLPDALISHLGVCFDLAAANPSKAQSQLVSAGLDLQNSVELGLLTAVLTDAPEARAEAFGKARDIYARLFTGARELIDRGHGRLAVDILSRIVPLLGPLLFGQKRHILIAAKSLGLMACALDDLSEYESSLTMYEAASGLLPPDDAENRLEKANILANMGSLHQNDGHFELSGVSLEAAIRIFETLLPNQTAVLGLASALVNLGHSDNYRGRSDNSRQHWRRAIEICEEHGLGDDGLVVDAYIHLVSQQFDAREWFQAIGGLRKAWRVAVSGQHASRKAELVAMAGQACLRGEEIGRAVRIFSEAARRYRDLAPDYANDRMDAMRGLARARGYAGDYDHAKSTALSVLEDGKSAVGPLHEQNMRTKGVLADLCWETGDYGQGLVWAREAVSDCDRLFPQDHFWRQKYDGVVADFLMATGQWTEAFDLLLSNIEREAELTVRLIDDHSDLLHVSAMRTASSHMQLAIMAALRIGRLDQRRGRRLMEAALRFAGSGTAILAQKRRTASAKAASYIAFLQDRCTLIALSLLYELNGVECRALGFCGPDRCEFIDLGPAASLNDALKSWSVAGTLASNPVIERFLARIRKAGRGCERLVWLPDRDLALYPLQVVETDSQPALLTGLAVVQSRDIHAMVAAPAISVPDGAVLVGLSRFDTLGDDSLDDLPEALNEIRAIAALYNKPIVLTNADATPDRVLAAISGKPGIVHVATHGLTGSSGRGGSGHRRALRRATSADSLASCAIVLAPTANDKGLLTARRVAGLDLSGIGLMVLAACDSGVGPVDSAEGILGFQSALHLAGVSTVVTCLWPLSDDLARELMVEFHKGWLDDLRPSEALRLAQLKLARNHPSPVGWGGLTVSGCDEPRSRRGSAP